MLDQVNLDCFLASDNANKQGNTKTTTAPHKAPEYLIIFPIEGINMANNTQMTNILELMA